jgi:tRNA nucleotidyltransferase (CCA-adding enzyme)
MEHLPAELACAARAVAGVLGAAGHRAWLVGGAVRDLALEVEPQDVDLASAARPEEIEALFPSTVSVGRAFGTVVVRSGALDLQVTTFRAEAGYDDARRPRHVHFATSLTEDAARRDFTCNALYLDPLNDEFIDPTGGLVDLMARRLRCVGDAAQRFREDGLRLLRLARLAAQHGLAIEEATQAGARAALDSLRGVSPERVYAELVRMAAGAAPARAVRLLFESGVLARLPGVNTLVAPPALAQRVEALARMEGQGTARFFATLFHAGAMDVRATLEGLRELRPPRDLHQRVGRILELVAEIGRLLGALVAGEVRRSLWIRAVRADEFDDALAVWNAWHPGERSAERARLLGLAASLTPAQRRPPLLVTSSELARLGIPRGPRWGELLRAAEDAQLDGEWSDLAAARAWLARHARE